MHKHSFIYEEGGSHMYVECLFRGLREYNIHFMTSLLLLLIPLLHRISMVVVTATSLLCSSSACLSTLNISPCVTTAFLHSYILPRASHSPLLSSPSSAPPSWSSNARRGTEGSHNRVTEGSKLLLY